jgi:hypothetical protein
VAPPPLPPLELLPPAELPEVDDVAPLIPADVAPALDEPPAPELVPPWGSGAVSESLVPEQAPQIAAISVAENQPKTNCGFDTLIMTAPPKIE